MSIFPFPGAPRGWAKDSIVGDGKTFPLVAGDRANGFTPDGPVPIGKLNALEKEQSNQTGFLLGGYSPTFTTRAAGAVLYFPALEDLAACLPVGGIGVCSEDNGTDPAGTFLAGPIARRCAASGDAVYAMSQSPKVVKKLNRTTLAVIWTYTFTSTSYGLLDVCFDGLYAYVLIYDATTTLSLVAKLDATTGALIALFNLSIPALEAPLKLITNGEVFITMADEIVYCYNRSFVEQWTYDRGEVVDDICIGGAYVYLCGEPVTIGGETNVGVNGIRIADGGDAYRSGGWTVGSFESVCSDGLFVYAAMTGSLGDGTADDYQLFRFPMDLFEGSQNVFLAAARVTDGAALNDDIGPISCDGTWLAVTRYVPSTALSYVYIFDALTLGQAWVVDVGGSSGTRPIDVDMDGVALYVPNVAAVNRFTLGTGPRQFMRIDPPESPYARPWADKLLAPLR